jgi:hypothetical protein
MNTSFKTIWVGIITNLLAIFLIWRPGRATADHNIVFDIRFAYLATFMVFGVAGYYLNRSKAIKEFVITTISIVSPIIAFSLSMCYFDSASWFVIIFLPLVAILGFVSGAKLYQKQFQWLAYSAVGCIAFVLVYVPNANNLYFINQTNAQQTKANYHHLVTANGQPIDTASLRGKVIIVEWIGTTIDTELISRKQAVYSKYANNPNLVLYFAVKGQPKPTSNLANIWYDANGNFSKYFPTPDEPFTSVIDKNGVVQWLNGRFWGFSEDPFVFIGTKDRWIELALNYQ